MFIPVVNIYFTYLNLHFIIHGLWILFWNPGVEIEVTDEMMEGMDVNDMEFLDEDEDDQYEVVFTLDDDDDEEDEDEEDE